MSLMPIAYLYPQRTGFPEDSQWLVIEGEAVDGCQAWSFTHPAFKISEVEQLASWLQRAASGEVSVVPPERDGHCPRSLGFEDPNLAFSLAGGQGTLVRLRIRCSGECPPPRGAPGEGRNHFLGHVVVLSIAADDLVEAGGDLVDELAAFPVRI
jgi:hypothetical protein